MKNAKQRRIKNRKITKIDEMKEYENIEHTKT